MPLGFLAQRASLSSHTPSSARDAILDDDCRAISRPHDIVYINTTPDRLCAFILLSPAHELFSADGLFYSFSKLWRRYILLRDYDFAFASHILPTWAARLCRAQSYSAISRSTYTRARMPLIFGDTPLSRDISARISFRASIAARPFAAVSAFSATPSR